MSSLYKSLAFIEKRLIYLGLGWLLCFKKAPVLRGIERKLPWRSSCGNGLDNQGLLSKGENKHFSHNNSSTKVLIHLENID